MRRRIESELLKKDLRQPKYRLRVIPDKKKISDKIKCRVGVKEYDG